MSALHRTSNPYGQARPAGAAIEIATHHHQTETVDAMEAYFECITTCSLEDGECVTRCVEELRERA
jgi:hypothetical protein